MREYRFNLFGVGGVLILGRRGPRLKAIVDAVEIRTPDDSALARVRAADPASDDDLVTRRHLQASTTPKLPLPATGERLIASYGIAGEIRESPVTVDSAGNMVVPGNLTVQGDSVILNTEVIEVEDQNIVLAKNATTDAMANGGGITLKGAVDKVLVWLQARAAWFSSENIDLAAGKELRVDGTEYLAAHSTTNLPEGTNLYFTDQRARDANNDHRADGDIHISPAERTAWNEKANQASFNAHTEDIEAHFAPGEKTAWNNALSDLAAADADLQDQIDTLSGGGTPTLEKLLYGVDAINPLATLHEQFSTIAGFVAGKNQSVASTSGLGAVSSGEPDITVTSSFAPVALMLPNGKVLIGARESTTAYNLYLYDPGKETYVPSATGSITASVAGMLAMALLPNGKVLIGASESTTAYNLYLYDPENDTTSPAGTSSITVSNTQYVATSLLPNGKVLIVVPGSWTAYNLYLYDPEDDTASPAGTASIAAGSGVGGIATSLLPNGKVLIVIRNGSTAYNLYLYDPEDDTASPAGTSSLTVSNAQYVATSLLPNGKVLIVVPGSSTAYNLYLYDPEDDTASPAGTASLTVSNAQYVATSLLPNGKVLIVIRNGSTAYDLYLYDPEDDTASPAGTASIAAGSGVAGIATSLLPNGKVLIVVRNGSTTYNLYIYSGPWCHPNRYQFPIELLLTGLV